MNKGFYWNGGEPVQYTDWAHGHPEAPCVWMDTTQESKLKVFGMIFNVTS